MPDETRSGAPGTAATGAAAMPDQWRDAAPSGAAADAPPPHGFRTVQVLVTLVAVAVAALLTYAMWQAYMGAPWTRDGRVRAYVVSVAPEVSGRVEDLRVADNQFVRKGDLLMTIDRRDYTIAVQLAQASVDQAKADYGNKQAEAKRRAQLSDLATTAEEQQSYEASAQSAYAVYQQGLANLDKARLNLDRTEIHSPVNGWITNLQTQLGDYASTGARVFSILDSDSFWIDGYFEETKIAGIRDGDPAKIWLLGFRQILTGHVDSLSRGIVVSNAQAGSNGLADVNPIFTWVRLAQRIPVRIRVDALPPGVRLVAGMTATVEIDPPAGR